MNEQAQPAEEEQKKHGDVLDNALKPSGQQGSNTNNGPATSGKKKE